MPLVDDILFGPDPLGDFESSLIGPDPVDDLDVPSLLLPVLPAPLAQPSASVEPGGAATSASASEALSNLQRRLAERAAQRAKQVRE